MREMTTRDGNPVLRDTGSAGLDLSRERNEEPSRAVIARVRTVDAILGQMSRFEAIRKADLRRGDRVIVETENSLYRISVEDDGSYSVSGGWFDKNGVSPVTLSISGCTWGGTAIKRDLVAARGLRLEFGNRVVTSPIREVRVIRGDAAVLNDMRAVAARDLFRTCYGEPAVHS